MSDWLKAILTSGAVWGALLALANAIIIRFVPTFPLEILALLNALAVLALGAAGVKVSSARVKAMRAQRARGEYRA